MGVPRGSPWSQFWSHLRASLRAGTRVPNTALRGGRRATALVVLCEPSRDQRSGLVAGQDGQLGWRPCDTVSRVSVRRTWWTWTAGRRWRARFHRLGWQPVIDLGWIVTLADPASPGVEFSLKSHDESASLLSAASVEVDDVNAHVPCLFFGRDPGWNVVSVGGLP